MTPEQMVTVVFASHKLANAKDPAAAALPECFSVGHALWLHLPGLNPYRDGLSAARRMCCVAFGKLG